MSVVSSQNAQCLCFCSSTPEPRSTGLISGCSSRLRRSLSASGMHTCSSSSRRDQNSRRAIRIFRAESCRRSWETPGRRWTTPSDGLMWSGVVGNIWNRSENRIAKNRSTEVQRQKEKHGTGKKGGKKGRGRVPRRLPIPLLLPPPPLPLLLPLQSENHRLLDCWPQLLLRLRECLRKHRSGRRSSTESISRESSAAPRMLSSSSQRFSVVA